MKNKGLLAVFYVAISAILAFQVADLWLAYSNSIGYRVGVTTVEHIR